jgi:hypothetical protein
VAAMLSALGSCRADMNCSYLSVFAETFWPAEKLSSAAAVDSSLTGHSGILSTDPFVSSSHAHAYVTRSENDRTVQLGAAWLLDG